MRRTIVVALALLVSGTALGADDGVAMARRRAGQFESSLGDVKKTMPGQSISPPEKQRPLFEAFFATLKTSDDKIAFLETGGQRWLYYVHPVVFGDYAAKLLADEETAVRRAAVVNMVFARELTNRKIYKIDGAPMDEHMAAVAKLLNDPDEETRAAALKCVGLLHGDAHVKQMIEALSDKSAKIRTGAASGLVALAAGAKKVPEDVRKSAVLAVAELLTREKDDKVIAKCLYAFGGFGTELRDLKIAEAGDACAKFLGDPDHRDGAVTALGMLGAKEHADKVAKLADVNDSSLEMHIAFALREIGTRDQAAALGKLVVREGHESMGGGITRGVALDALDKLDARDQRPAVEKAAKAGDKTAIELLAKWDRK